MSYTPVVLRVRSDLARSAMPDAPVVPERPARFVSLRLALAGVLGAAARRVEVPTYRRPVPAVR